MSIWTLEMRQTVGFKLFFLLFFFFGLEWAGPDFNRRQHKLS